MHVDCKNIEIIKAIGPSLLVRLEINAAPGFLNLDYIHILTGKSTF